MNGCSLKDMTEASGPTLTAAAAAAVVAVVAVVAVASVIFTKDLISSS